MIKRLCSCLASGGLRAELLVLKPGREGCWRTPR
jgi:hypothetical protein